MRFKAIPAFLTVLVLATLSFAQTKISGTVQCSKPDQQQKIEIGDQPGHAFAINQGKCKWTKPMEIAGTQTKEDIGTGFDEINGNKSHGHGYVVGTLANGDKMHVRTPTMESRWSTSRTETASQISGAILLTEANPNS